MNRLTAAVVVTLAVVANSAAAQARGIHLKGNLINSSAPIVSTTGTCACVWSWSTVALRPGAATVTTHVQRPGTVEAKSYQLTVVFIARNQVDTLKKGTVTCSRSKPVCGKTLTLHLRIQHRGVYYIQVRGRNAEQLWFSMSVHGNILALHCNLKKRIC